MQSSDFYLQQQAIMMAQQQQARAHQLHQQQHLQQQQQQQPELTMTSVAPGDEDSDDTRDPSKPDKRNGRRKIKIEYIEDKSRRHITFSKRKAGIMKKAYELSTLTGTQVLLLVVSETGLVYTFTTPKLQPLVTEPKGKNLIQLCLNAPDGATDSNVGLDGPPPAGGSISHMPVRSDSAHMSSSVAYGGMATASMVPGNNAPPSYPSDPRGSAPFGPGTMGYQYKQPPADASSFRK